MGNPRRFLGCGQEMEIDGVIIPARCAVEVTFRTLHQCFQLRPDPKATEIILGCFGRAYHRYPGLNVNVLSVLSNHGGFIALPETTDVLSNFMRDFMSTAGKRLNELRGRKGVFWERRYRAIPIVDEEMLDDRFCYVLTQGTKENLVWSARDWPGVNSAKPLLGGAPLVGRWRDRTREGELVRQRNRKISRAAVSGRTRSLPRVPQVWYEYPIELVPLTHWQALSVGQRRAHVASILAADDNKTLKRHESAKTQPLGQKKIVETPPDTRPDEPAKSPAPLCHASTKRKRNAYRALYREFLGTHFASREKAKSQLPATGLPLDATMPPLCHSPPRTPSRPAPTPIIVWLAGALSAVGPPPRPRPQSYPAVPDPPTPSASSGRTAFEA